MDWKSYYDAERRSLEARRSIRNCFARYPRGDEKVIQILQSGGVVSFPHTSIHHAGEPLARVVTSLYHIGMRKVIALGVLHGGTLPERPRELYEELSRPTSPERARELFAIFQGAFTEASPIVTPFGELPVHRVEGPEDDLVREGGELLANEFSLDALFSLLALYAREHDLEPIPVLPLFIGLVRDPEGSFTTAARIARRLREIVDGEMALVATGDLVHYGTAYSSPEEMGSRPTDMAELKAFFSERVRDALGRACQGDYEAFYRLSVEELKSDQRQIVPIICEYLGEGAGYELLQFELSDYAPILQVEPPCVVASALVGFTAGL